MRTSNSIVCFGVLVPAAVAMLIQSSVSPDACRLAAGEEGTSKTGHKEERIALFYQNDSPNAAAPPSTAAQLQVGGRE